MDFEFSEKTSQFKAGIFAILNEKKLELQAQGRTIYNLSVGTPDFQTPEHIRRAVSEAAMDPENWKYALYDRPFLKEAVAGFYQKRFGVTLKPEEIMTVSGSQEAMAHIAWALTDPGDVVLVPNPGYPIFSIGPGLCGAKVVTYDLHEDDNYMPHLDEIPQDVADAAKFILVSYPLNPVCTVAGDSFYEELIAWARKHNVIVLHDNAYSDIIYGGRTGRSFLSYEGAKEVGVEFYSLSKSYNMTGGRTSLVLGNESVVRAFSTIRSQYDYGMFLPLQYGMAAALTGPQESVKAQCAAYERRMKTLCGGLREIGWNVPDSQGTMFVWAPLPAGYTDSEKFTMDLMQRSGVIVTPGSSFGSLGEGHVRMALVLPEEEMKKAVAAVKDCGILG